MEELDPDDELDIRDSLCAPLGSLMLGQELRSTRHSLGSLRTSLSPATPRLAKESSGRAGLGTPSPQAYSFWYGHATQSSRRLDEYEEAEAEALAEAEAARKAEAEEMHRIYEQIFHVRELRCLEGLVPGVCLELESYAQSELEVFNDDEEEHHSDGMRAAYDSSSSLESGVLTEDAQEGSGGAGSGYRKKSFVERTFQRQKAVSELESNLDDVQGQERESRPVDRVGGLTRASSEGSESSSERESMRRGSAWSAASSAGSGQGLPGGGGGSLQRRTPRAKEQARKQSLAMLQVEARACVDTQAKAEAEAEGGGEAKSGGEEHAHVQTQAHLGLCAETDAGSGENTRVEVDKALGDANTDSPRKHMLAKSNSGSSPAGISASSTLSNSVTSFDGSMRLEEVYDKPPSQKQGLVNPTPSYKGPAERAALNATDPVAMLTDVYQKQSSGLDGIVNPTPEYIGPAERQAQATLPRKDFSPKQQSSESPTSPVSPTSPTSPPKVPESAQSDGASKASISPHGNSSPAPTSRQKRGTKTVLNRWQNNMASPNPPVPTYLRRRSLGKGSGDWAGGGIGNNCGSSVDSGHGGRGDTPRQTSISAPKDAPKDAANASPTAAPISIRGEDTFSNFPLASNGKVKSTPSGRSYGAGMRTPDGLAARVLAAPGSSRRIDAAEASPAARLWTPHQPPKAPDSRPSTPMRKSRRRIEVAEGTEREDGPEEGSKIAVRKYSTKKIVRERWKHAEKAQAEPPAFFRRNTARGW